MDSADGAGVPGTASTTLPQPDTFQNRVILAIRSMNREFGGPRQYLQKNLDTEENEHTFYEYLIKEIPLASGAVYADHLPLTAMQA